MLNATQIDTSSIRTTEFPMSEIWAYLNHATVGPLPQRTVQALDAFNRGFMMPHIWESGDRGGPLCELRTGIARLAGGAAERVAIVASAAHGISICAAGIDWRAGDEVVIPHSEYPSLAIPFLAQAECGVVVRWAAKNAAGRTDLNAIEAAVTPRTRAVAISQVEFADGFRNDLTALGSLCRDRGLLLIVDATQSLGAVPLDVDGWGVHAAVSHGYKWLHAGFGIGVAIFSEEGMERIRPTHGGSASVCENPYVPEPTATWHPTAGRFEPGGQPFGLITGMLASLSLIEEVGAEHVLPHVLQLIDRLVDGVTAKGYKVNSSLDAGERSSIVAISAGTPDADLRAHVALSEAGVVTVIRSRGIRVAPSFYNDASDIERLIEALPEQSVSNRA
ncbi:MAG TPA: aminotransferase class V-fold PLP-dependent enzyme [Thermomicrobiales bacterium]|nr:aminotransferase class V-fold PLP-dependent enzyme [Thermomicrobiales bacterium]